MKMKVLNDSEKKRRKRKNGKKMKNEMEAKKRL